MKKEYCIKENAKHKKVKGMPGLRMIEVEEVKPEKQIKT